MVGGVWVSVYQDKPVWQVRHLYGTREACAVVNTPERTFGVGEQSICDDSRRLWYGAQFGRFATSDGCICDVEQFFGHDDRGCGIMAHLHTMVPPWARMFLADLLLLERVLEIPESVDSEKVTTGIVMNDDGSYHHVPTEVFKQDNKWYARVNSLTNSHYGLIWNPVLAGTAEGHWSRETVNDMASRLVLIDAEGFVPDTCITRGELAGYVVRALGLRREDASDANRFMDVAPDAASASAILTAHD